MVTLKIAATMKKNRMMAPIGSSTLTVGCSPRIANRGKYGGPDVSKVEGIEVPFTPWADWDDMIMSSSYVTFHFLECNGWFDRSVMYDLISLLS